MGLTKCAQAGVTYTPPARTPLADFFENFGWITLHFTQIVRGKALKLVEFSTFGLNSAHPVNQSNVHVIHQKFLKNSADGAGPGG